VNSRRLLAGLYLLLFLGISLGAGTLTLKTRQEYGKQRRTQAELAQRLDELKAKVAFQERYLKRLREDPVLVERLLRQRLNYSRPNEWVFDFSEGL
jgi:cell division protein DivIC